MQCPQPCSLSPVGPGQFITGERATWASSASREWHPESQLLCVKLIWTMFSRTLGQKEVVWARSSAGDGTDGTDPAEDGCLLERFTVQRDSPLQSGSPQSDATHSRPLPSSSAQHLPVPPEKMSAPFTGDRLAKVRAAHAATRSPGRQSTG